MKKLLLIITVIITSFSVPVYANVQNIDLDYISMDFVILRIPQH